MNRNKLSYITLFAALLFSIETKAADYQCAAISKAQVTALLDQWGQSLKTKDPAKVAENYAPDAVLVPTFSNSVRKTPAMIRAYFANFLSQNPSVTIDQQVIHSGCNWASNAGLYTFQVSKNGKTDTVRARYSFVYKNVNGKWLILQHHSSAFTQ